MPIANHRSAGVSRIENASEAGIRPGNTDRAAAGAARPNGRSGPNQSSLFYLLAQSGLVKKARFVGRSSLKHFLSPLRSWGPIRRQLRLPAQRAVKSIEDGGVRSGRFHLLDAATTEYWPAPNTLSDAPLPELFAKGRQIRVERTGVLELPGGRFWGAHGSAIFDADDRMVWPLSRDPWGLNLHSAYVRASLPPIDRRRGKVLIMATPEATSNYHHWMIDLVPRFELVRRAGFDLKQFDHVVINHSGLRYQLETFARVGLDQSKIIRASAATHLAADQLVVPTFFYDSKLIGKRAVNSARNFWLSRADEEAADPSTPTRIYLSRRDASFRKVTNEDEVRACLVDHGFSALEMSKLTVAEQARILSRAKVVVGPAGANLANIMFVQPGTDILELMPSHWVHPYNWGLAVARGANFNVLVDHPEETDPVLRIANCHKDFTVNIDHLNRMLVMILQPRAGSVSVHAS